jgi:hypothetical protein
MAATFLGDGVKGVSPAKAEAASTLALRTPIADWNWAVATWAAAAAKSSKFADVGAESNVGKLAETECVGSGRVAGFGGGPGCRRGKVSPVILGGGGRPATPTMLGLGGGRDGGPELDSVITARSVLARRFQLGA